MLSTDESARDVAIAAPDGMKLRGRYWPVASPRGVVIISHGFGEHGGSYEHVARAIGPAASVDIAAIDFRGHGRSSGRRGLVRDYQELIEDLIATFEWAGRELPGLPRFLLGHSNGGQVALRASLDPRIGQEIQGLILSNPSIRVVVHVPGYKLRLGRFLRKHAPWVTLPAPLEIEKLTRDPEMQRERGSDPLCHSRISPALYFGMVEGGRKLIDRACEIRDPILMILGGDDPIVDPEASRHFFDLVGSTDKTLKLYPGMLHEPFNDLGREQVFAEIVAWLDRHLPETRS